MSRKYKFHNTSAPYFVSFAPVHWMDIFTDECYFQILADSIAYCRKHKGMELFANCFMPNHVHLIFRSDNEKPMELLRDFKKHTAKHVITAIRNNPEEDRKDTLLGMMEEAGKKRANITKYQFWQHDNHPIELWSTPVIKQKVDYIHNNPVKAGLAKNPLDWKYSSARNFAEDDAAFEIDSMGFLG